MNVENRKGNGLELLKVQGKTKNSLLDVHSSLTENKSGSVYILQARFTNLNRIKDIIQSLIILVF